MNAEVKTLGSVDSKCESCIVELLAPLTEYGVVSSCGRYGNLDVPYFVIAVCRDCSVVTIECECIAVCVYKTDCSGRTVYNNLNVCSGTDSRCADNVSAYELVKSKSSLSVCDCLCSGINDCLISYEEIS